MVGIVSASISKSSNRKKKVLNKYRVFVLVNGCLLCSSLCLLLLFRRRSALIPYKCEHISCIRILKELHEFIDYSTHPCDDFYQFSCGNWIRKAFLPPHESSISQFQTAYHINLRQVFSALIKITTVNATELPPPQLLAVSLLEQCITQADNFLSVAKWASFIDELKNLLGPLPFHYGLVSSNPDLSRLFTGAHLLGMHIFFKFQRNANTVILQRSQFQLIPELFYKNKLGQLSFSHVPSVFKNYFSCMIYFLKLNTVNCELNNTSLNFNSLLYGIIDLDMKVLSEMRRSSCRQRTMSIINLFDRVANSEQQRTLNTIIDAERIVRKLYPFLNHKKIKIKADRCVIDILSMLSMQSTEIVVLYVYVSVIDKMSEFLGHSKLSELRKEVSRQVYGRRVRRPTWIICTRLVDELLPSVTSQIRKEQLRKDLLIKPYQLVRSIYDTLIITILPRVKWLAYSRDASRAEQKVHDMHLDLWWPQRRIGPYWSTREILNYKNVYNILKGNHLASTILRIRSSVMSMNWLPYWIFSSNEANAYFSARKNKIVISGGLVQYPLFFHDNVLDSLNFASLGFIVGHELTHAFDIHGRYFDNKGRYHENIWLVQNSKNRKIYQSIIDCLKRQYDNLSKYSSELTLAENMADNGGLTLAYSAWVHHSQQMIGIQHALKMTNNFSADQLFFIRFAQTWCTMKRESAENFSKTNDVHSNARLRVLGTLQNSIEFAQAFDCPLNSKMNPERKCKLW
ncbi:hypothetical protein GJ496_004331 [Pomphorhynchus laevis]|nr:hypothetical protein GJ496_004331 [Pomphorhynchus laevis]